MGRPHSSTRRRSRSYVVATRKFQPPLNRTEARELVGLYATWSVVQVDVEMLLDAAALEANAKLSFWDALIVEAARRAGAMRLVSEDLQAGRQIAGIAIENPFSTVRQAEPEPSGTPPQ